MQGKKLITGGAGFIGQHLKELYKDAHILDMRPLRHAPRDIHIYMDAYIQADVTHEEAMKDILSDYDIVFHLAALTSSPLSILNPVDYWGTNVIGTRNVCQYSKKVFFASSAAVYDITTPYALTKNVGEKLVIESDGSCGRFFNVFGENNTKGVIYNFICMALKNKPLVINGNGSMIRRDFIYVKDLVLEFNFDQQVYDIGTGMSTSIYDLATYIIKVCNSSSQIQFSNFREGDTIESKANCKNNGKYGFDAGLRRTINWVDSIL